MSFSSTVKNEMCRVENDKNCCLLSGLTAAVCLNGTVAAAPGGGYNIRIATENAAFARKVFSTVRKLCGIHPEVTIRKSQKLKKHVSYMLFITPSAGSAKLLEMTGLTIGKSAGGNSLELVFPESVDSMKFCCSKAFLRGAFLAGGSISDPERTYHLELIARTNEQALTISKVLARFDLHARIIKRKGSYVTYLKEGENIVDFLNITGAHKALMELENIRILKGMRNNVNRMVNCETANLEKTVNASLRQIENIRYISENIGFDKISPELRDIASLRLEYRDASLAELGQMMSPPLGKSGVNYRLRKLEQIAERHRRRAIK